MVLKMSYYRQSSLTSHKIVFVSLSLSNSLSPMLASAASFREIAVPSSLSRAFEIPQSKCKAIIHLGEKVTAWLTGKDMVGLEDNER